MEKLIIFNESIEMKEFFGSSLDTCLQSYYPVFFDLLVLCTALIYTSPTPQE